MRARIVTTVDTLPFLASAAPRALVIEDDPIVARLLAHALTRRGFTVRSARDGRQAVEVLATTAPPNVVILDLMLPYMDGFELLQRIQATPRWESVPVIVLTSASREQSVVRALNAGATDYVVKPFRPEELIARVRRMARAGAA